MPANWPLAPNGDGLDDYAAWPKNWIQALGSARWQMPNLLSWGVYHGGYDSGQNIRKGEGDAMNAGELIKVLSRVPPDMPLYLQDESGWIELNFVMLEDLPKIPYRFLFLDHRAWIGSGNVHYGGFRISNHSEKGTP